MKLFSTFILSFIMGLGAFAQTVTSFEDFDIPVDSFWNGSDLSGAFVDGGLICQNYFDTTYNYWAGGWAVSTMRDDSTAGFTNLYSAITAKAARGDKYAIGQNYSSLNADGYDDVLFQGLWITNSTYAYLSMKNGDSFAKKFGGDTGDDPDFFKLRIYAVKGSAVDSTNFVDFYLADFRDSVNTKDYIVDSWKYVDLSSLGYVRGISFELSSSDNSQWGMNTPGFFAVDKVKISYKKDNGSGLNLSSFEEAGLSADSVWIGKDSEDYFVDGAFEYESKYDTSFGGFWSGGFALSTMRDDSTIGYTNLYGVIPGGAYDGLAYAVSQNNTKITSRMADAYPVIRSIKITNTTYAYYSMKYGDSFAKKFGGDTGHDPDFFKLRIIPKYADEIDFDTTDYYDFYLADFRFDDDDLDYIVDDWTDVSIDSVFGRTVVGLAFELSSSDNGQWGMNTPAFFAIDRLSFDIMSGTIDQTEKLKLDIYPNPATDYIKVNSSLEKGKYEIFSIEGTRLLTGSLNNNDLINVDALKDGFYFLVVSDGQKKGVERFVITNNK